MKRMSQKQLEANRNNSLLGGVKTENGKQKSKFNALKHGILRESITEYEDLDYSLLYESLVEDFKPNNTVEEILIERIAMSYIKLKRIAKAEKERIQQSLDPTEIDNFDFNGIIIKNGYTPKVNEKCVNSLSSVYSRYETTTENKLYKAIDKLIALKQYEK